MKKILLGIVVLMMLVSLSGCANKINEHHVADFDKYYEAKVQYVGNNSEVMALLDVLGAYEIGEYTIALDTDEEPFGITINYKKSESNTEDNSIMPFDNVNYAFYLLSLIDNLDYVEINYDVFTYELTKEEATHYIGQDIKTFGESVDKLKELDKILSE